MNNKKTTITRRDMLKNTTVMGLGGPLLLSKGFSYNPQRKNKIEEENSKLGTLEWQLQYTGFDTPVTMASYPMVRYLRSKSIEGYANKASLLPGETID